MTVTVAVFLHKAENRKSITTDTTVHKGIQLLRTVTGAIPKITVRGHGVHGIQTAVMTITAR